MTKIYTKGGDKGQTGLFSGERVSKNNPLINALGTVDELNSVLGIARSDLHRYEDHARHGIKANKSYIEYAEREVDIRPRGINGPKMFDSERYGEAQAGLTHYREQVAGIERLAPMLHNIQLELFELGAELASGQPGQGRITDDQITRFEQWIDELTAGLPELKNFILPTGHPVAAHLHLARTVSRRAERAIVAAWDEDSDHGGTGVPAGGNSTEGQPVPGTATGEDAHATNRRFDPVVVRYMNRLNDLLFVLAREANRIFSVADEEWHSPKSST